ncbi:zinc finger protein 703 [Amia ocellicauda]|uniref:zinc finger protein 703 n=1 Tax=Amia ocellicauda TaxID=2972642 RepID=UPI0034639CCF
MNDSPRGSNPHVTTPSPAPGVSDSPPRSPGRKSSPGLCLSPADPQRQAKRLPIRVLKMLTAHTGHLLHPEYLQPLTSAPVSIELDAKKSPLALLAQTCSQIGKPDPPPSSKLNSVTSSGLCDKEPSGRASGGSGLKLGAAEHQQSLEDKSSFKPYSKIGGDCRKDGTGSGVTGSGDKAGFRLPSAACPSFPPHAMSPNPRGSSPPQAHPQAQSAPRQTQTPPQPQQHLQDSKAPGGDMIHSDNGSNGHSHTAKRDSEPAKGSSDSAHLANSSHGRATANSSSASSENSPHHDGKGESLPSQTGLGSGHIAPVSPFKPGHSVFPLPPSSMGYHGSIVGAYAGYPSQFVPGLDHTKSSLVGGQLGVPGKHPSSSPLTGASPPSFMQGLCRDPYCLSYPNAPHLGGSNCSSCVHDPSSSLKSGYPLVYPTHPLHSIHPSSLSSSATPTLSGHPLYTYGFMLQNDPLPHICNWVSASGPCDKRFSSSEELLAHLRTHTALPGADKLLAGYPSSGLGSAAAACHLHLPPTGPGSPSGLPGSFSLRSPHSLGLSRYHPYGKAHLPSAGTLPMHTLQASAGPYYSPYALYTQRLGSASALGYQ